MKTLPEPKATGVFVGIDVAKDSLEVHVLPEGASFKYPNTDQGCRQLVKRLASCDPERIVLEPTGGYEQRSLHALALALLPVALVNAKRIRDFAKAIRTFAKTDPIDAFVLATFAGTLKPELLPLPDEREQRLAGLVRRRTQLVKMKTAEKVRLQQEESSEIRRGLKKHLRYLEKEIATLEQAITDTIKQSTTLSERVRRAQTVPGVGPQVAAALVARCPELGTLSNKAAAALAGLAPFTRESGKWRGKSFVQGGRSELRAMLYMTALQATHGRGVLAQFYQRLRSKGKPAKVALTACMRKIIVIGNVLFRDETDWDEARAKRDASRLSALRSVAVGVGHAQASGASEADADGDGPQGAPAVQNPRLRERVRLPNRGKQTRQPGRPRVRTTTPQQRKKRGKKTPTSAHTA